MILPLKNWSHSRNGYHRSLYYGKCLDVEEISGSWYVWIDGDPQCVPHSSMSEACRAAEAAARKITKVKA